MKIIHHTILFIVLLMCGCCHTAYRKGFYIENNAHQTLYISSSTALIHEFPIKPKHCELIKHFKGELIISNGNGSYWIINDCNFDSRTLQRRWDYDDYPLPPYVTIKQGHIPLIYYSKHSIKIRVDFDKLYVMPSDEHLHGYYKRLQPEGFPISRVETNLFDKIISR